MTTTEQLISQLPSKEESEAISIVMDLRGRLSREFLRELKRSVPLDGKRLRNMGLQSYERCYIPPYQAEDKWLSCYYDNFVPFCYNVREEYTVPATLFMFRFDPKLCSLLAGEILSPGDLPDSVVKRIPKSACGDDLAGLYVDYYSEDSQEGRSLVFCLVGDNGEEECYIPTVISNQRLLDTKGEVLTILSRGLNRNRKR